MKKAILEVCVDSTESAMIAERGGANRVELCSNLIIGGTTPGMALYEEVRKHTNLKVHALIRPRFGDFLYDGYEFACIQKEVEAFVKAGVDGVVIGCLREDGTLDLLQMQALMELAKNVHVTLHRAFDMCRDPLKTMHSAIDLGVDTILTSGQEETAVQGIRLIEKLDKAAEGRIAIMPGAGINASVIQTFMEKIPSIRSYHMSGKKVILSGMTYRKEQVHMGLPGLSEYEIWRTDEEAVLRAREVLDR